MRRRVRNNDFARNVNASCGLKSRAGRSLGRRRPANIRLSPGVPRGCVRIQALLCHSERSEESMTNDKESDSSSVDDLLRMTIRLFRIGTESPPRFSPGPAAGVASPMRAGPGARSATLASALPHQRNSRNVGHACRNVMLSKAKHLIQILRRSAPQNDKLLNCSQTPQQTGICNWRQRGKVEGKDVRGGRSLQR